MPLNAVVGAVNANSYVTEDEAAAYFEFRTHSEAWDSVDNTSAALVTASRQLDWFVKWKGKKTSDLQAMGWPRTGVVIANYTPSYSYGVLGITNPYMYFQDEYPSDIIPIEVKVATLELALSSIDEDRTDDFAMAGIKIVKAGSVMVQADDTQQNTAAATIPHKIWKILEGFVLKSPSTVWLLRA